MISYIHGNLACHTGFVRNKYCDKSDTSITVNSWLGTVALKKHWNKTRGGEEREKFLLILSKTEASNKHTFPFARGHGSSLTRDSSDRCSPQPSPRPLTLPCTIQICSTGGWVFRMRGHFPPHHTRSTPICTPPSKAFTSNMLLRALSAVITATQPRSRSGGGCLRLVPLQKRSHLVVDSGVSP